MFKSVSRVLLSPPPNPVGRVHPTHRLGDLLTFTAALLFSAIAGHLTYLNWTPVDVQLFTFPARVQLIAAMNPCRCGHLADPILACAKVPRCGADYQSRLSGPLLDRIDLHVTVEPVPPRDMASAHPSETSAQVASRIAAARAIQTQRLEDTPYRTNAELNGEALETFATPDDAGAKLLLQAAEAMKLSARAYTRTLRVARSIADLAGAETIARPHIAEALSYRRQGVV